jgi:L-aspartate oxidase
MKTFDIVVLGSGIAGLSFALKVASHRRVAIVTKKHRAESNTNYAQGGIAAVTSREDSVELHVRDTLEAGAGLCKEPVVRTIIEGNWPQSVRAWSASRDSSTMTRRSPMAHRESFSTYRC